MLSLKLTSEGRPVLINPDLVTHATEHTMDSKKTEIHFSGGESIRVDQGLGAVLKECNAAMP
jgi:2,4-dienoyl-CoA reductase-like NADH-dependent reductase (Old Yellow Enzyme family)